MTAPRSRSDAVLSAELDSRFQVPSARTIPQMLVARAAQTPSRTCQREKDYGIWQRYTWADVLRHVRQVALGLYSLGLRRGDTVAVVGENEPEHYWAEFAAQSMGARVVSLYPDLTTTELAYILDHSEASFLIAEDQEQVDKGLEVAPDNATLKAIVYWDEKGMWSYRHELLRRFEDVERLGSELDTSQPGLFEESVAAGNGEDVAVISYTSGTTGRPKGVLLTYDALFDNCARILDAIDMEPGAEYVTYISPAWAAEQIFGVTLGLALPMVVNFAEEPEEVRSNIREIAVETVVFSPRQWENLAGLVQARMLDAGPIRRACYRASMAIGRSVNVERLDGRRPSRWRHLLYPLAELAVLRPLRDNLGLTRVRVALSAGSAMAPDVFRFFHAMGVPLRNLYGTTEAGLLTVHQGAVYDVESVGTWMRSGDRWPPIEWRIADQDELQIRGGPAFRGYHRDAEKTTQKWDDDWMRTGDTVATLDSGELVFLDRTEDMRALATGHSYPPQFIETRLRFSPYVKDVMILGDEARPYVAALVQIDSETVGRWAEQRLIGYSTFTDLSQNRAVLDLIRTEIGRVNRLLPDGSRLRRFASLPKELDPDEGELTRTRKLRREFLEERYHALIAGLYSEQSVVDIAVPITYQDGRRGTLRASVRLEDAEDPAGDSDEPAHQVVTQ